jgi:hypothetical protein
MIGYLVGYDSSNIYRIWIPSQIRVIRTKDVTFDHNRFYDPVELDIGHLLDMPAPSYAASDDIVEEDDPNDTIEVDSGPVSGSVTEATQEQEELSDEEPAQQMATPDPTPDREIGHDTDSAEEAHATRRTSRQPAEIPPDAVAMGTRSRRRQAYSTALTRVTELTPYYSAFTTGLQRPELAVQDERLHRDTLPPKPRNWRQMLKHRFTREFIHAAIQEHNEIEKRGTYKLTQKKGQKAIPLI